ncbi:MAG: acyl carrier protein [Gemmataceae bacterium]
MAPIREKVMEAICNSLGVARKHVADSTSFMDDVGTDSLDIVELVMELEEEFGVTIPDTEAEQIKTVGEAIDYIARHGLPPS